MTAPRVAVARWHSVPVESLKYYWQRLREAGIEPFDLSPDASLEACSGLVLTGGVDVDPALYGETRHPKTQNPDRERDEFELARLTRALELDMPVLAICRGHQVLNVSLGGKLLQHIEAQGHETHEDRSSSWHNVDLRTGTRLHKVLPHGSLTVNSRHHQAVTEATLAPGLIATATTPDSLVEGVESERHSWVIGVQWHPEREEPDVAGFARQSTQLFEALASAAQPATARR
jgi:putative glutamine amidotransferase